MIVTCESCKSRYKLDDSKITGRGAKITCPKCRHVFVVLAGGVTPRAAGGLHWEEDEPTRVEDAVPARPASRPVVEAPPPPPPSEVASPTIVPTSASPAVMPVHEVVRPSAAASGPKIDYAAKALTLDFRKVGVAAWKAKIKIGLVYDFSDIKTLRRYIQDGRVTPSDVISYDGKAWKTIGDIPDLDVYFVETYDQLERDSSRMSAPPSVGPALADLQSVAAAAAAVADPSEPGNTLIEAVKPKPRKAPKTQPERKAAPDTNPGAGARGGWIVAAVGAALLAGVGVWYGMQDPGGAAKAEPVAAAKPATPAQKKANGEDLRTKILDDINSKLEPVKPADGTPADAATAATAPTANPTTPPPTEAGTGTPAEKPVESTAERSAPVPEGAVPIRSGGRVAESGTSASASAVKSTDSSAADHEALGDQMASSGDWSGAASAYQKALSAGGRGGALLYKLGKAQANSNNLDAAAATLERAKASYPAARSLLADVYDKLGDPAKASAERQAAGGSR